MPAFTIKNIAIYAFFGLCGLIFLGGIGSYFSSVKTNQSPAVTPPSTQWPSATSSINDWKTFEDKSYGLSFKYSPLVVVEQQGAGTKDMTIKFYSVKGTKNTIAPIQLSYIPNPKRLSLKDLDAELAAQKGSSPKLIFSDDIIVPNNNNVVANYSYNHGCDEVCESYSWTQGTRAFFMINDPPLVIEDQTSIFHKIFASMNMID